MIIDELLTFFVAGMKTIQTTTTNFICYLEMYPEIKARLLTEIIPPVQKVKANI
jgi:cytochrome P450